MIRFALTAAAVLATATSAQIVSVTDDLTDGSFNPFFSYDFTSDFTGTGNDFNSLDLGLGLLIAPDSVFITFPGASGGEVLEVSVQFTDFTGVGATTFEAIGLGGSQQGANLNVSSLENYSASFTDIGFISSMQVSGFETYISSITVRYRIPTPATAGLFGLAGLAAARRRR